MPPSGIRVSYAAGPGDISSYVDPIRLESISSPPGGKMEVKVTDGTLFLDMSSSDLSTLRAMLNSYLGLLSVTEKANTV